MKKPNSHPTYETNPITLLIESAKRAFNSAQGVALYLILIPIGLSVVQFIIQSFSQVFGAVFEDNGANTASGPVIITGVILTLFAILFGVFINVSWTGFSAVSGLAIFNRRNETFGVLFSHVLEKFMKLLGVIVMVALYSLPWWIAAAAAAVSAVVGGIAGGAVAIVLLPISIIAAIFFIFMALRVNFRYALSSYALFDGKNSVSAAMRESKDLTKGRLMEVFGIGSLGSIVPFLSALLVSAGNAFLYEQLKSHRDVKDTLPRPHILNYLLIFIIGGFVLFIALIAGLVLVVSQS